MLIPFLFQSPNRSRSWLSYASPTNVNRGQGCICKDESMIRHKSCVKMMDIFYYNVQCLAHIWNKQTKKRWKQIKSIQPKTQN